jgi:UDP-glucose 4-epimerase
MRKEIILTGSRGRLANILRHFFEKDSRYRVHGFSRTQGDGHLLYPDMFTSGILARTDVLFHLAWSTVPITSEQQPGLEWQVDLPALAGLLQKISKDEIRRRIHFIFFSSGGTVYGNAPGRPSNENDPVAPRGWHGSGKVAAEHLINQFAAMTGLRSTILRLSNPFGFPSVEHRPQGAIPLIIRAAYSGEPFKVWGDGNARKDFIYYTDMTAAVEAIIEQGLTGTFNISAGKSFSIRAVAAEIERLTERQVNLTCSPEYAWDVTISLIDNTLLRSKAGWTPVVPLDEGLKRTIKLIGNC